ADIFIATNYFTKVTNITSSVVGTVGVTNFNSERILIDYTRAGTNLQPGQLDIVTITMIDKYINYAVPANALITSKVRNATKTNNTTDYSPKDRKVYFVPQEARAECWTVNESFLSENSSFTLFYAISNKGSTYNKVGNARIYFTNTFISIPVGNVTNDFPGSTISLLAGPIIDIDYSSVNFDGKMKDVIKIVGNYSAVGAENTYNIQSRITVNTSILVPVNVRTNNNVTVHFEIPRPSADTYINPNIVFTTSSQEVNYLFYYITNTGFGGNNIKRAEIIVPDLYLGKVTIVSSAHINADATSITNKNGILIASYVADSSNLITTGGKDTITLALTNTASAISNVTFDCRVYNFEKNKLTDTKSGFSKIVSIVDQATKLITPNTNFTTDVTNEYRVKLANGTIPGVGRNIYRARLTINTQIYLTAPVISIDHYAAAMVKNTNTGGIQYRWIDYSANPLISGNVDDFKLTLVDKVLNTNSMIWNIEVDYNDGYGFRSTRPKTNGGANLAFVIPNVEGSASISPANIAVANSITPIQYSINNTGDPGNDILLTRILIPNPDSIFTNIETATVSNTLGLTNITFSTIGGSGHIKRIILNYAAEGKKLTAGTSDVIYFNIYDSVVSGGPTKYQFSCDAANTMDTNFSASTTKIGLTESIVDAQKVQFSDANFDSYAYILSHSPLNPVDTTTSTNIYTYYIYNSSLTAADRINQVRISIPTNFFITNGIQISSTTNPVITRSADKILLNYNAGLPPSPIQKGTSDTITIRMIDKVFVGNVTGVTLGIEALFDTSTPNFIPCDEPGGNQFQSLTFKMPPAVAQASISPNYTLTVNSRNTHSLIVTNKGTGSNKIFKTIVTVNNAIVTNIYNVQSSLMTTGAANLKPSGLHTNSPYAGLNVSSFTLYYNLGGTVLNPNARDTITFTAVDNHTNNLSDTNVLYTCIVANESNITSTNFYATTIPAGRRMDVDFKHYPGYPYANNNVEAGFVDSEPTFTTNAVGNYIYRIKNNGPSGNNIEWAVITIPNTVFTDFYNISSSRIGSAFIQSNTSSITLYYARAGNVITPGNYDDISFIAVHNISSNTNVDVSVEFPSVVHYQTNGTPFQTENLNGAPLVQYVTIRKDEASRAFSYIHSIVKMINGYPAEVSVGTQAVTYTMDTNIVLRYKIVNQSASKYLEYADIIFNMNITNTWYHVVRANAYNPKGTIAPVATNVLRAHFTTVLKSINLAATEDEREAIIDIPIIYSLASETNIYISGKYGLDGATPDIPTTYDANTRTQKLQFRTTSFGRFVGRTFPPDLTVTKQVVTTAGNEQKSVFNQTIPQIYSDTNGVFILDFIPAGTFNLKLLSEFPTTTINNLPITGGVNTTYFNYPELFRDFYVLSYISSFSNFVEGLNVAGLYDSTAKSYTLDNRSVYYYTLQNRYTNRSITNVTINFTGPIAGTWFTLLTNDIVTKGMITNISESNFHIYYNPPLSGTGASALDLITLPINYSTAIAQNLRINASYNPSGTLDPYSVADDNTQLISYSVPTFGRIIGKLYPPKLVNSVNKIVATAQGGTITTTIDAYHCTTNGVFVIDNAPTGTYNLKFVTDEALSYTVNGFTISAINHTYISDPRLLIDLKFAVNPEEPGVQRIDINDAYYTNTALIIPSGSSLDIGFRFNIRATYLTDLEKAEVSLGRGAIIQATSGIDSLVGFDFDIEDLSGEDMASGVSLKSECQLMIQYDKRTFPTGWSEDNLAIFYWDEKVNRWYKMGGIVDKTKSIVTVNLRYLHRRYAVMSIDGGQSEDIDVNVDNNPFTPDSSDPDYNHTIINFRLKEPATTLELKIFNMKGEEVIGYQLDGSYLNGQQSWNGIDKYGRSADSGIYIFQIIADDSKIYTGSILLVK
ncbi:MAG: hypothetical protein KKH98_13440, partial [Spirochaetes bacterium]|nr:hypothetical protein [Spirochaetota bacterium]